MVTKGQKALVKYRQQQTGVVADADELLDTVQEELDAWEICYRKKPDLCQIDNTPTYEFYIHVMGDCEDKSFILESEEFWYLKEMLK